MALIRLRRRRGERPPRILLLEASVAAKVASTRLSMLLRRIEMLAGRGDEQARRLAGMLRAVQLALERVSLRLETLAYTGVVSVEELSTVREVLRLLGNEYKGVVPGLQSVLSDIEALVVEAATASGVELEAPGTARVSEEARRILEEARAVAEARAGVHGAAASDGPRGPQDGGGSGNTVQRGGEAG